MVNRSFLQALPARARATIDVAMMAATTVVVFGCQVSPPNLAEDTPAGVPSEILRLELVEKFPVVDEPNHWVELNESGTGLREFIPSRPHEEIWDDRTGGKFDSDGRLWVNSQRFTEDGVRIWNVFSPDRTHLFDVAVRNVVDATGDRVLMGTRTGAEPGFVDFYLLKIR